MKMEPPAEKPSAANPLPATTAMPGTPLLRRLIAQGRRRSTPTPEEVELIRPVATLLLASLAPARPERAANLITRLIGHYPQQPLPEEVRKAVAEDWLEDLAHLPEDIIDAACAGWRRAENRFAPTPGHILAIANPILASRRFLAHHAAQMTGLPEPGAAWPGARPGARREPAWP